MINKGSVQQLSSVICVYHDVQFRHMPKIEYMHSFIRETFIVGMPSRRSRRFYCGDRQLIHSPRE